MLKLLSNSYLAIFVLLFKSVTADSQWIATVGIDSQQVYALTAHNGLLFAGTTNGAYRSSDDGMTWKPVDSGLVNIPGVAVHPSVEAFASHDRYLYAGTYNGTFVTTDDGNTWGSTGSSPEYRSISSLVFCESNLLASGSWDFLYDDDVLVLKTDLFLSPDNGVTWASSSAGMPNNPSVFTLRSVGKSVLASTEHGLYVSTDDGVTWTNSSPPYDLAPIFKIATSDSIVIAVSRSPLYLSSDVGKTWTLPSGDSAWYDPGAMCIVHNTLAIASPGLGITVSTDWGISWKKVNDGLDTTGSFRTRFYLINTLMPVGDYIFASSPLHLWRRPLSEITRAPISLAARVPSDYSLEKNFPNPFNPNTEIIYKIPSAGYTSLEVFDVLGRRITILVSRFLKPGVYSSKWDGSTRPSGIYIYRFNSGSYSASRKMILIK